MISPQFPYTGSQAIITSDRVMLYSKLEGVFLFGKATVGLSSPSTINIDSKEGVLIYSPFIFLGSNATEKVILGNSMVKDLLQIITALEKFSDAFKDINETNFAAVVPDIRSAARILKRTLQDKKITIPNNLSKVTYTQ